MRVKIYVEGGGDSNALHSKCRRAFSRLFERASSAGGRSPAVKACGTRSSTFGDFATAMKRLEPGVYPILLVDSESPVDHKPWVHLKTQDGWNKPAGAEDDQAHLMVQCMETWIVADPQAVQRFFGHDLQANALPATVDLEKRPKDDIQAKLVHATKNCGSDRKYRKGKRSFELLAQLDPEKLRNLLPHFCQLCNVLERKTSE